MVKRALLTLVCIFVLAACGSPPVPRPAPASSGSAAGQSPAGSGSSAPVQATAAAAPGCGVYCQQAGESAGSGVDGYPCPANRCLKCPPQNCMSLGGSGATVINGVAKVPLTCNLQAKCQGAILFCLPVNHFCQSGPTEQASGGRLAGSDFVVAPGSTSEVPVGLTPLGEQVISTNAGGFDVTVLVDVLDYGYAINTSGPQPSSFTLTTSDPPAYPSGATAGCGGTLFAGPGTTCPFANNVEQAYSSLNTSGSGAVTVSSPVTGQSYQMQCTGGSPVVCRGGTNAVVEFYT